MSRQTLHAFIDTSTLLSFYAYTKDDVDELEKLVNLIRARLVKLYLTQQVLDEFYRNREKKLHESLANFENLSTAEGVPRFMNDYPQVRDYRKALKQLVKTKDEAIQRAKKEAAQGTLAADALFRRLIEAAQVIRVTKADYGAALRRMRTGNPPGKDDELGDRVNWEVLLRKVPKRTDLHIVSRDGDFVSPLDPTAPHGFLAEEWKQKREGSLLVHAELRPFLADHFPKIKLAVDVEKRSAIERLQHSGSFSTTHTAIAELAPFTDALTAGEIEELIQAAKANSQIAWIARDPDVKAFYEPLLERQHDNRRLSDREYHELRRGFGLEPDSD